MVLTGIVIVFSFVALIVALSMEQPEINKPRTFIEHFDELIQRCCKVITRTLGCLGITLGSVVILGCLGILGYAVIIFLIKFVRSNLTL